MRRDRLAAGTTLDVMIATQKPESASAERIKAKLLVRETRRRYVAIGSILAGLPLLLPAPLLFACVAWYVLRTWTSLGLPYWTVFWLTALVIIPLCFLTELRTRGGFLNQAFAEAGPVIPVTGLESAALALATSMGRPMTGALALMNPRLSTAGLAELMLTGPRWILGGIRGLRLDWRMRRLDRDRAARMLADLLTLSSGTDPKKLAQPGETMDQLDATLAYLVTYGWVGLTTTMDRVYVYSETREVLSN